MRKFKTILSLFLAIITVLSICVIPVSAEENPIVEYKVLTAFDTETFKTYYISNTNADFHFVLTNEKLAEQYEFYEVCDAPDDFNKTVFDKAMNMMFQLGEEFYDLTELEVYSENCIEYVTQLYLLSCLGQDVSNELNTLLSSTEDGYQSYISFYNLLKEKEDEIENIYEIKYTFYAPIDKTNHNQIIVAVEGFEKPENALIVNRTPVRGAPTVTVFSAEGYEYLFCTNRNRTAEKNGDYITSTDYSKNLIGREIDQEKMQKICYTVDTFSKTISEDKDLPFRVAAQCFVWASLSDADYINMVLMYSLYRNEEYQNMPNEEVEKTAPACVLYNQMVEFLNNIDTEDYKLYDLHYFKRVPFGTDYQVLVGYTVKTPDPIIPETTSLTVSKVWVDDNNENRPSSVEVQLYQNGTTFGEKVILSNENAWTYTFDNLDVSFEWSVDEVNTPDGYEKTVQNIGNIFTITNTLIPTPKPEPVSVSVVKKWEDNNNTLRPTSITVQLYNNNVAHGNVITLSAENNWSYTWNDLDAEGVWNVDEVNVPENYEKTISNEGNTFTITNTYIAPIIPEPETVSLTVIKEWNDNNNPNRPKSAEIQLYKDNVAYGEIILLNTENNWSYTFENLDANSIWSVDEVNVPDNYEKSVFVSAGDMTTTIINTYVQPTPPSDPDEPSEPIVPEEPNEDPKPSVPNEDPDIHYPEAPQTGDNSHIGLWVTLLIMSASASLILLFARKRFC